MTTALILPRNETIFCSCSESGAMFAVSLGTNECFRVSYSDSFSRTIVTLRNYKGVADNRTCRATDLQSGTRLLRVPPNLVREGYLAKVPPHCLDDATLLELLFEEHAHHFDESNIEISPQFLLSSKDMGNKESLFVSWSRELWVRRQSASRRMRPKESV